MVFAIPQGAVVVAVERGGGRKVGARCAREDPTHQGGLGLGGEGHHVSGLESAITRCALSEKNRMVGESRTKSLEGTKCTKARRGQGISLFLMFLARTRATVQYADRSGYRLKKKADGRTLHVGGERRVGKLDRPINTARPEKTSLHLPRFPHKKRFKGAR